MNTMAAVLKGIPRRYRCGKKRPKVNVTSETVVGQLDEIDRAERLKETSTVLSQPHRKGDASQLRESALGRFALDHGGGDSQELFEAGRQYWRLVNLWRWRNGVEGARPPEIEGETADYREVSREDMDELKERIRDCNSILLSHGKAAFSSSRDMILDDKEPHPLMIVPVKYAMRSLALLFRLL